MESIHSIILIKKDNKFLNYYDERWDMYLFPNIKGNDIEEIKEKYNTDNVKFLFDKVHDKYSEGKYFTLDELLEDPKVKENNSDIIGFIKEYYNL